MGLTQRPGPDRFRFGEEVHFGEALRSHAAAEEPEFLVNSEEGYACWKAVGGVDRALLHESPASDQPLLPHPGNSADRAFDPAVRCRALRRWILADPARRVCDRLDPSVCGPRVRGQISRVFPRLA